MTSLDGIPRNVQHLIAHSNPLTEIGKLPPSVTTIVMPPVDLSNYVNNHIETLQITCINTTNTGYKNSTFNDYEIITSNSNVLLDLTNVSKNMPSVNSLVLDLGVSNGRIRVKGLHEIFFMKNLLANPKRLLIKLLFDGMHRLSPSMLHSPHPKSDALAKVIKQLFVTPDNVMSPRAKVMALYKCLDELELQTY